MRAIWKTVLLLLLTWKTHGIQANLWNYVGDLIANFPNYTANMGLDPTIPILEPYSLKIDTESLKLDVEITDYQIHNHSQCNYNFMGGKIEFTKGEMHLEFRSFPFIPCLMYIDGHYTANGTLNDTTNSAKIPVNGNGNWKVHTIGEIWIVLDYQRVNISAYDYVNLKSAEATLRLVLRRPEYMMDGLSATGQEMLVRDVILNTMINATEYSMFQVQGQLHDYFVKALEVTPISMM